MRNLLRSFIIKYPLLYNIVENCYSVLRKVKYKFQGTETDEKYWARRHISKKRQNDWNTENDDWIISYWKSIEHPHRQFLIDIIADYKPMSILEIGCNCGPNLCLLAKKFPDAEITGIDINPAAVKMGKEMLIKENISNVKLLVVKADELKQFKDNSFDVVFTDAVLIYLGPDKIKKVLEEMLRISIKALILFEWQDFKSQSNPLGKFKRHWVRNYFALIKEFIPEEQIKIIKSPKDFWNDKNWQKYGAVIEIMINK